MVAFRAGATGLERLLYDRLNADVHRLVWRVLGPDPEHEDIVQLVFERIFDGLHRLREPDRLQSWVRSIAIHVAKDEIRRRRLRRILRLDGEQPETDIAHLDDHEGRDLVDRTYRILERMPAAERVVFALRYLEQLTVTEIADACECSIATVNRRLAKAEKRFTCMAGRDDALAERLAGRQRWRME